MCVSRLQQEWKANRRQPKLFQRSGLIMVKFGIASLTFEAYGSGIILTSIASD